LLFLPPIKKVSQIAIPLLSGELGTSLTHFETAGSTSWEILQ
jgi:hypothetical protein